MDTEQEHLSQIVTLWTIVFKAHQADETVLSRAQARLLERYAGAIYRYLLAAVRDANVADDLAQDFALGMCKGLFKHADPHKGRFRDYVKTALAHLVAKHYQRKKKQPVGLDSDVAELPAGDPETAPSDEVFLKNWRQELLSRAWEALAEVERTTGKPYHTFLEHRTKNANTSSAQMAVAFGQKFGKVLKAESVRQTLHRARQRFSELLLEEVSRSLETRERDRLECELLDLGLFEYCKDTLKKWS